MMYDELVKRIWECASGECFNCSQYTETTNASVCSKELMKQAADAIEELSKRVDESIPKDDAEIIIEEVSKPRWIPVTEWLPESSGSYIVYLRPFKGKTDRGYMIGDLSYPTEMYFDKGQMLWVYENESYNAVLSAVDTENEYHVTHWMPLPQPPKEVSTNG